MEMASSFARRNVYKGSLITRVKFLNNLNEHHLSQRDAMILNKPAAEFGIQLLISIGNKEIKRRGILDFKKRFQYGFSV